MLRYYTWIIQKVFPGSPQGAVLSFLPCAQPGQLKYFDDTVFNDVINWTASWNGRINKDDEDKLRIDLFSDQNRKTAS